MSAHANRPNLVVGEWGNLCVAMWVLVSSGAEQNGVSKVRYLVGALFTTARTACARGLKWQVKQDGTGQGHPSLTMKASFWLIKLQREDSSVMIRVL